MAKISILLLHTNGTIEIRKIGIVKIAKRLCVPSILKGGVTLIPVESFRNISLMFD